MGFKQITNKSISELVANRLLDMIRDGKLSAGEKLPPERELAMLFNVGRPAIREAIRGLSLMGVIKVKQGDGNFINSLEPDSLIEPISLLIGLNAGEVNELFEARKIIEGGIVELSCLLLSDAEIESLKVGILAAEQALRKDDIETFKKLDIELHETIIQACDNSYLKKIALSLKQLGNKSRAITLNIPNIMVSTLEDHRQIVVALEERNPQKARQSMITHLSNVQRLYNKSYLD